MIHEGRGSHFTQWKVYKLNVQHIEIQRTQTQLCTRIKWPPVYSANSETIDYCHVEYRDIRALATFCLCYELKSDKIQCLG